MTLDHLPRLLYIGDVPVESSCHGSALIFRLLQNYPTEKLRIIEGSLRNSLPQRRLEGVRYDSITIGWARPLYTRFSRWANLAYSFAARWTVGRVEQSLNGFKPEAVLTVTHDFLWLSAARYARKHSLPLHLICHDDWPRLATVPTVFRNWLEKEFGEVYRQAASRLCVSPYMAEEYERRYGAKGKVLYPSRADSTPAFDLNKHAEVSRKGPFTVAYAGSIATGDYVRQLATLSQLLSPLGGKLLLFGPFDKKLIQAAGMNLSSAVAGGLLSSAELVQRLHEEADVLFLPMSFVASELEAMALNFPSKLTDYTAAALPLLIWGPESSSAVKWAASEPGVAAVVTSSHSCDMEAMLKKLMLHKDWRDELAAKAVLAGNKYFKPTVAYNIFLGSLAGPKSTNVGYVISHAC